VSKILTSSPHIVQDCGIKKSYEKCHYDLFVGFGPFDDYMHSLPERESDTMFVFHE
jgi:hypothetical protein